MEIGVNDLVLEGCVWRGNVEWVNELEEGGCQGVAGLAAKW